MVDAAILIGLYQRQYQCFICFTFQCSIPWQHGFVTVLTLLGYKLMFWLVFQTLFQERPYRANPR